MTETIVDAIARQAETDLKWGAGDAVVSAYDAAAGDCRLYLVRHRSQPPASKTYYAMLPDGQIVSPVEDQGAARILRACGSGMSADAWAEVVTGFSPGIGPGRVLHEVSATVPQAPVLKGGNTVEFHWSLGPTSPGSELVTASLGDDGVLKIARKPADR